MGKNARYRTIETRDRAKGRKGEREKGSSSAPLLPCCQSLCLCAVLSLFLLFASNPFTRQSWASETLSQEGSEAERTSKVNAKVKLSFGYDNNLSECREDKVESRFFQFYINSGMYILPFERTLLSLKLQDGLKYLDAPSLSGESVLINSLSLNLSHRLSERLIPEIQSEIRGRTSIHSKTGVSPSEEAYLRGFTGLALKIIALSDVTGKAFCRYRFTNFEDFDPFDRRGPQVGLRTDVRLLPSFTISVQYSRGKADFHKWDLVSSNGKTSRIDIVDDISLFMQFYKYFLFDITYSHQNNRSDISEYSYGANRLAFLLAKSLPRGITFQLHALIRSKKYRAAFNEDVSAQVDLEDDERGLLTVELSKDISEGCALEAQYDLRRSRSYKENGLYTKSVFSSSLSFHF